MAHTRDTNDVIKPVDYLRQHLMSSYGIYIDIGCVKIYRYRVYIDICMCTEIVYIDI
jgi:hypothetical protein